MKSGNKTEASAFPVKIERDQDGEERVFYLMGGVWVPEEERTRCEVWSRVMGYFRPVSEWNIGKKQEFEDRKPYRVEKEELER